MSLVQAAANDNALTGEMLSVTLSSPSTKHNTLLFLIGIHADRVVRVFDDLDPDGKLGRWTKLITQIDANNSNGGTYLCKDAPAGISTVKAIFDAPTGCGAYLIEEDAISTTTPLDVPAVQSLVNTSGSWTGGPTATTTQANTVGYGFGASNSAACSFAAGSGWTAVPGMGITAGTAEAGRANLVDGNTIFAERQVFSSSGAKSATGTAGVGLNISPNIIVLRQRVVPEIIQQPGSQTVRVGDVATFTVEALSSGGSLTYDWEVDTGGGFTNAAGTQTNASYTTGTLSLGDDGAVYRCNVTDSNGTTTTTSATLHVRALLSGTAGEFDAELLMAGWF